MLLYMCPPQSEACAEASVRSNSCVIIPLNQSWFKQTSLTVHVFPNENEDGVNLSFTEPELTQPRGERFAALAQMVDAALVAFNPLMQTLCAELFPPPTSLLPSYVAAEVSELQAALNSHSYISPWRDAPRSFATDKSFHCLSLVKTASELS